MNVEWRIAGLMFACLMAPGAFAQSHARLTARAVDAGAIAKIPKWQGNAATVISHLDLARPFDTKSQWTLVVLDDPHLADSGNAPIAVCFVQRRAAQCTEEHLSVGDPMFYQWRLVADRVVYVGSGKTQPLLWLETYASPSVNGNGIVEASLFRYDRNADRFDRIFLYDTPGSNSNQKVTFIDRGPIMGDVVTDYPTYEAPYSYWIEVYAPTGNGEYKRILRYRGHTGYGDSNPLSVADSEMPQILRRLGYWKPGDALPLPTGVSCPHPVLRHEEEWCKR